MRLIALLGGGVTWVALLIATARPVPAQTPATAPAGDRGDDYVQAAVQELPAITDPAVHNDVLRSLCSWQAATRRFDAAVETAQQLPPDMSQDALAGVVSSLADAQDQARAERLCEGLRGEALRKARRSLLTVSARRAAKSGDIASAKEIVNKGDDLYAITWSSAIVAGELWHAGKKDQAKEFLQLAQSQLHKDGWPPIDRMVTVPLVLGATRNVEGMDGVEAFVNSINEAHYKDVLQVLRATDLIEQGQYDQAEAMAEGLAPPMRSAVWVNFGQACAHKGDQAHALKYWQMAIRKLEEAGMSPDFPLTLQVQTLSGNGESARKTAAGIPDARKRLAAYAEIAGADVQTGGAAAATWVRQLRTPEERATAEMAVATRLADMPATTGNNAVPGAK